MLQTTTQSNPIENTVEHGFDTTETKTKTHTTVDTQNLFKKIQGKKRLCKKLQKFQKFRRKSI